MSWIALTANAFKDTLLSQEKTAIDAVGVQDGKTAEEVLTEQIARTVNMVRGYIPASVPRGASGTIPDELEQAALCLLLKAYFTRVGLKRLWTDPRNQDWLQAIELLQRCSNGRFLVAPPEDEADAGEQPQGGGVELVEPTSNTPVWSDVTMDGL